MQVPRQDVMELAEQQIQPRVPQGIGRIGEQARHIAERSYLLGGQQFALQLAVQLLDLLHAGIASGVDRVEIPGKHRQFFYIQRLHIGFRIRVADSHPPFLPLDHGVNRLQIQARGAAAVIARSPRGA